MKRTQVQLRERTYQALRHLAYKRGTSISAVVREILDGALGLKESPERPFIRRFSFIGSGYSEQKGLAPVSERHDEALARGREKGEGD